MTVFAAVGLGLLPWTAWLLESLKPHHVADRWDVAWSGFDSGLAVLFLLTAAAAYRRSPWVLVLASATGTLLVTDAWFDVVLESHADELRQSILLAVFAELPAAGFCFFVAFRTEQFLARIVDSALGAGGAALHVASPGQRATEGDLVGVLEVTPDGEPAGEPGHPDAPA